MEPPTFPGRFKDLAEGLSRGEIPESYRHVQEFKAIAEQFGISYAIALLPGEPWSDWVRGNGGQRRVLLSRESAKVAGVGIVVERLLFLRFEARRIFLTTGLKNERDV